MRLSEIHVLRACGRRVSGCKIHLAQLQRLNKLRGSPQNNHLEWNTQAPGELFPQFVGDTFDLASSRIPKHLPRRSKNKSDTKCSGGSQHLSHFRTWRNRHAPTTGSDHPNDHDYRNDWAPRFCHRVPVSGDVRSLRAVVEKFGCRIWVTNLVDLHWQLFRSGIQLPDSHPPSRSIRYASLYKNSIPP